MAARRHERTKARRIALQVLYSGEITEISPAALVESGALIDEEGAFGDYARRLVEGVSSHVGTIDSYLVDTSENWSLSRMPIVDRSLLRLATFEMIYVDEVPISVSINEAVELAKEFGGEDESPRFVNGVLGRIAQRLEAGQIGPDIAEQGVPSASERTDGPDVADAEHGDGFDDAR